MNFNKLLLLFTLLAIGFWACKKENITEINKKTVTVSNNQPPNDTTQTPDANNGKIDTTTIDNYIYKTYISLAGRKPTDSELNISRTLLLSNNAAVSDRKTFVSSVQGKQGYYDNLFRIANTDLMNGQDTADISLFIIIFEGEVNKPENALFKDAIQAEIDRLVNYRNAIKSFSTGLIAFQELHKRMCNNYFYDQLNMGSLNYIVSLYQHFLFRYPTSAELTSDTAMCNGLTSISFHVNGASRNDFINIFFNTSDYYEGQIRDLYKRHLYRDASSVEASSLAQLYKNGGSYKDAQREILITNEYIGIK